jgi:hypothetical protein
MWDSVAECYEHGDEPSSLLEAENFVISQETNQGIVHIVKSLLVKYWQ